MARLRLHGVLTGLLGLVLFGGCSETPAPARSGIPPDAAGKPATSDRPATAPRDDRESHARMLATLEQIRRRSPDENRWLGDLAWRQARDRLAALPSTAPAQDRWQAHLTLGLEELRLGHGREAIVQLEAAVALIPPERLGEEWAYRTVYRLALAYLRLGETRNCALQHTAESCILPIRGAGRHVEREGSAQAVATFSRVLELAPADSPVHLEARWLLNLAHMTLGQYPQGVPPQHLIPPEAFDSDVDFPRFRDVAPDLGLDTVSMFGGVACDDFDSDGYLDVFTTSFDTASPARLFRNDRAGGFADVSDQAGLAGLYGGLNLVQADHDNDGDVDVFILRGAWLAEHGRHPNSLLRNDGGRFTDVTYAAGLAEPAYPTQTAAWADYDNDGDADLFVGNETSATIQAPSQLFRNDGDGTFTDVARSAGITRVGFVKGCVWGDYDADRDPDLYVSVMGGPNQLYRNDGDGTFTDVAAELGVDGPVHSFPVWFWDFDNDGALDLYVPSYHGLTDDLATVVASYLGLPARREAPRLYRGDGRGGFEDVAAERGLTRILAPMGANRGDLDNDGFDDFYLGTGYPDYEALMPNVMYRNVAGRLFEDVTWSGGFGHLQKGHAVSFADLDNDGDLDVFAQMGGAFPGDRFADALFENPGFGNHWIGLELSGTRSNRSALGARIRIDVREDGRARSIHRHVGSGGSFGSNPLRQVVGLGRTTVVERLEVYWPTSDITQSFEQVEVDRLWRVVESAAELQPVDVERLRF